jgi:hypothetical protein
MNEERTGKCLRQVKHIRGHLLNISKNYKYYLFFPKASTIIFYINYIIYEQNLTNNIFFPFCRMASQIIYMQCSGYRVAQSLVFGLLFIFPKSCHYSVNSEEFEDTQKLKIEQHDIHYTACI